MSSKSETQSAKHVNLELIKEICSKVGQAIQDIEDICNEEEIPEIEITP